MEEIKAWLNGRPDYLAGVALYFQHGKDPLLKRLFQEAHSPFKEKKLRDALQEIYTGWKKPVSETVKAKETVKRSPFNQYKHWPPQPIEDPVLLALWQQWKPLYGELKSLQHRIYDVAVQGLKDPNKALEAGQMTFRILDLDEQIEGIYAKRNFYYDHKRLPEEAPAEQQEEIVDPIKWKLVLDNYMKYVRDYKVKLKKFPGHKNADKWAMKLKEYEAGVLKYKKLLKIID